MISIMLLGISTAITLIILHDTYSYFTGKITYQLINQKPSALWLLLWIVITAGLASYVLETLSVP